MESISHMFINPALVVLGFSIGVVSEKAKARKKRRQSSRNLSK